MVRLPPVLMLLTACFGLLTLASPAAATQRLPLEPIAWTSTFSATKAGVVRKGVRFRLRAYLVRARRGWGLEVEVRAGCADGRVHALPPRPLMFSGMIRDHCAPGRCGTSGFGEGRGGSSHLSWTAKVGPRRPKMLMRPYPRSGRKLIRPGQTLTLSVSVYRYGRVGRVVLAVPRRGKPRVTVLAAP